jgi:Flp pilus assembly pilin Flp
LLTMVVLRYCCITRDQALQPPLPRAMTLDAGASRGGKPRPARWIPLWRDRRAVSSVEYAVIAGVMVLVVFTVSGPFAVALGNMFVHVTDAL